jgi:ABC-type protease/lipase transport system fused ATPase/permease subunit
MKDGCMASFLCLCVFVSFLLHVCLGIFACFGYSCIVTTTSVRLTTVMTKDKMMTMKDLHGKCKTTTKSTKTLPLFPSSQKHIVSQ